MAISFEQFKINVDLQLKGIKLADYYRQTSQTDQRKQAAEMIQTATRYHQQGEYSREQLEYIINLYLETYFL